LMLCLNSHHRTAPINPARSNNAVMATRLSSGR
jgi:hypothetical protein